MADGTSSSVGKISLQVDLEGDLTKQLQSITSDFSNAFKKSLEKAMGSMLTGLEKVIDTAMNSINSSIKNGLDNMKKQTEEFVKSIQSITSKIKVPNKMPIPTNLVPAMNPVIPSVSPRGPPIATPALPGINAGAIQAEIDKVSQHLDLINQKIELQQSKLVGLKDSYERALNPNIKNKLASQINNTELSIMKLTEASDKMGFKLSDLDSKMNGTAQATSKMSAAANVATEKMKQSAGKATQSITPLGKASQVVGNKFGNMGKMITSALKRVLIMATLYKVIRGFMSYMNSALATNTQFASSLAQIKSNLQVAFMPIYNAILPAINSFMNAIARATAYMASFLSVIFGSTFKASSASAKALNTQKAAIAGVGAASKKTAKEVQKSLAGFDEITNLSTPEAPDAGGGGGGGASGIAPIVSPGLDTSAMENSIKAFLDKLAPYFEPIKAALGRLKEAFEPLKDNLFAGLKWLYDNVLLPLGKWTVTELIPRWIDELAGVFDVLNAAINALKPTFQWLWDNLFKPLAEWYGGVTIAWLDGIVAALKGVSTWIDENQKTFEVLATVIGAIAIAWGIVNTAIGIWAAITAFVAPIMAAISAAGGVMAAVMAAINIPIIIAVAAVAALIAIGILLWKNWDQVSAWLKKTWEGIKTAAATIWGNIVSTIKGVFTGIGNWFSGVFTGAWNGIKKAFSAVGSFFNGIWTTIKNTFTTIGSVIGNGIGNAFKLVVNSIITFAERTINGFIRAINNAIKLINLIPGVNISSVAPLSIPKLATGGMIEQPTLAMVGEAGKEAVVPLDRDKGAMQQIADMITAKMGGGGDGGDYETSAEVDGDILFKIVMKRLNKRRRQKNLPIIEY